MVASNSLRRAKKSIGFAVCVDLVTMERGKVMLCGEGIEYFLSFLVKVDDRNDAVAVCRNEDV